MSAATAAAAAAALSNRRTSSTTTTKNTYNSYTNQYLSLSPPSPPPLPRFSRYELQKRLDWDTFRQYLHNHHNGPPVSVFRCSGAHVVQFLLHFDQFGKTKVHINSCPFFGHPHPPAPCPCPLKQAWSSLDALISRLSVAFVEHGGSPDTNPFGAHAVGVYLRDVKDSQAKERGIA